MEKGHEEHEQHQKHSSALRALKNVKILPSKGYFYIDWYVNFHLSYHLHGKLKIQFLTLTSHFEKFWSIVQMMPHFSPVHIYLMYNVSLHFELLPS